MWVIKSHRKMWDDLKKELYLRMATTDEEIGKNIAKYFLNLMRKIEESHKIKS